MHVNIEEKRLDALYRLKLLDTAPSESFDRITRMAGQLFGLPIAAVSLTDRDRQWFKSRIGVEHCSIPREKAPCAQVAESADTLLIPDLKEDDCYRTSLLADQGVRFYAGAPLTTREGYSLGSLCVLGTEPRQATEQEMRALNDLAKMVMAQIELQHAFGRIDPVSGIPNRTQFLDDLADLARDQPDEKRLVVMFDLARPEQLSNGLRVMGAAYMDEIVQNAAQTISTEIRRERTVYHVGATQFAFLAPPGIVEEDYLAELGKFLVRHQGQLADRFTMSTSIGVASFLPGETTAATVLRAAHSAAQEDRNGCSTVSMYDLAMDRAHQRRFQLLSDFDDAWRSDRELSLVFQPRIHLETGTCLGAEALLRWNHPKLGPVSPAEFIPVIEQTSLAGALTEWVMEAALAQLRQWRDSGLTLQLSINVSAANLENPDFANDVQLRILKHRVRPEWVELEVTESAIMSDFENAVEQLGVLCEAGVQVAIDDFGTGYSSLAYLQKLPGRILKIDQSIVRDIETVERDAILVRSMISLSHELGYRVVAEGVETVGVHNRLLEMGCDEAQGYYYAKPMDRETFQKWNNPQPAATPESFLSAA